MADEAIDPTETVEETLTIDSKPILGLVKGYEQTEVVSGGDKLMKYKFTLEIGLNGALIDNKLIFNENEALRHLRDVADTKRFASFRNLALIELKDRRSTNSDIVDIVKKDLDVVGAVYPHGVVSDYMIDENGLSVVIESIDLYSNDSISIRNQIKHRQLIAIPIIEKGSLIGLGIVVGISADIKNRYYRM